MALVLIVMDVINLLFHPIYGNETKCCFEPYFPGEFGMVSCELKFKKKTFLVGFKGAPDNDGFLYWDCTFPLLWNFVTILSSFLL